MNHIEPKKRKEIKHIRLRRKGSRPSQREAFLVVIDDEEEARKYARRNLEIIPQCGDIIIKCKRIEKGDPLAIRTNGLGYQSDWSSPLSGYEIVIKRKSCD